MNNKNFNSNRNNANNNSKGNWLRNNNNKNNNAASSSGPHVNASVKLAHDVPRQSAAKPNASSTSGSNHLEEEFKKWEEQFTKWLDEMKDHPDREQYEKYKSDFLQQREMLITVSIILFRIKM